MEEFGPLEQLFAFLVVLYLVECVRWVGRGSFVLRSILPGQWALDRPWEPAPQWRRALAWTAPWPPLGALYVMDSLPVGVGPHGVTVAVRTAGRWTRPSASTVHVPWEAAGRLRIRELELSLDAQPVAVLGTRRMAVALEDLFTKMAAAKPSRRQALLDAFLEHRFDRAEIAARRKRWRRLGWPLVLIVNVLFVALIGCVYAVLFTSLAEHWQWLAMQMALLWSITVALFTLTMFGVLPKGVHPSRFRRVITFLSPMSLVRSADDLRAELYGDCEPIAVAATFERSSQRIRSLRTQMADWRWPLTPSDGPGPAAAQEDDVWLRDRLLRHGRALLQAHGLDEHTVLFGDVVRHGDSHAFCPRCLSQYVQAEGDCANCPGVELQAFETLRTPSLVSSSG